MSDVLSVYKLTPSDPSIDKDSLYSRIKDEYCNDVKAEFVGKKEEPGPFGMFYITLYIQTPDTEVGSESLSKFEELLEKEEAIQSWEMELQTLATH